MKFGETIEAHKKLHPEWSIYYLDYVNLVHILEDYQKEQNQNNNNNNNNNNTCNDDMSYASRTSNASTTTTFSILHIPTQQQHWITTELLVQLHVQLEQMTLFLLQQQGIIATQMSTVRTELRQYATTATTFSSVMNYHHHHHQHPPPSHYHNSNSHNNNNNNSPSSSAVLLQQRPPSHLVVHTNTNKNMVDHITATSFENTTTGTTSNQSNNNNNNHPNIELLVQQYEERYYQIGIQLLRLYQFIDINVTGIRKLLKKHDKIVYGSSSQRRGKHSKLSLSSLLWNTGGSYNMTNHTNIPHLNRTVTGSSDSHSVNNIHSVIPWSPRVGGSSSSSSTNANMIGSTTLNMTHSNPSPVSATAAAGVGIYTRRKLSAEAFGNALLQPLLHDEGLTAITATLEVAIQELYALLILPNSQQQQHRRNSSDASLDFLWDTPTTTNTSTDHAPTNTNYGSTMNTTTTEDSSAGETDTVTPLLSQSPPVPSGSMMKHPRGLPQAQSLQLPPKQPPSRSMGVQSARVQSRKTFHQHRPSLTSSLRSVSTSNVLGNSSQQSANTIPGLSSMDSLLIQIQMARRKLHQTNGYIQLLAAPMMMNDMDMVDDDETGMLKLGTTLDQEGGGPENMAFILDEEEIQMEQSQINISNLLNLGSSMLYMCNYYIVAPTSASYAERLGGKASLSSMIIGMTPVAALISTILFSWWTNHSYKYALIFASACSVLGNLFYAFGLPTDSIIFVMVGRLLTGFGSARSINRRYICDTFPRSERTAASAAFVTASAMGMAAGPAIASILHYITTDQDGVERVKTLYWQSENAPGWFMVLLWSVFLVCLVLYFEDPPKKKYETALKHAKSMVDLTDHTEAKPLLSDNTADTENAVSLSPETSSTTKEPPIWRNIPVMITFLIYFVLKLVLEAVLSSSAVLTEFYFDWDSGTVGWYLAILGLLVLPANAVVATLAQSYDDRELITGIQIALFIGCLCMLQFREVYHLSQYIIGTILLVVSANALEGPNMSLLSQTIPKSWSTGIFNVGLLSTEAGTFGRAMGNVLLTVFGNDGLEHLLNRAFGTFSVMSFIALYITYYFYDHLEPWDVDD